MPSPHGNDEKTTRGQQRRHPEQQVWGVVSEDSNAAFVNGINVSTRFIKGTFIPNHADYTLSLTDIFLATRFGHVRREEWLNHVRTLMNLVNDELKKRFDRFPMVNGIDVRAEFIKNTFFPNYARDTLSLTDIFLVLRRTSYTLDDLPKHVRVLMAAAKPIMDKTWKRPHMDDLKGAYVGNSARFINGIDVFAPFIQNTFMPTHAKDRFSLVQLSYLRLNHGFGKRENVPEDVPEHVQYMLEAVAPELDEMLHQAGVDPDFFS